MTMFSDMLITQVALHARAIEELPPPPHTAHDVIPKTPFFRRLHLPCATRAIFHIPAMTTDSGVNTPFDLGADFLKHEVAAGAAGASLQPASILCQVKAGEAEDPQSHQHGEKNCDVLPHAEVIVERVVGQQVLPSDQRAICPSQHQPVHLVGKHCSVAIPARMHAFEIGLQMCCRQRLQLRGTRGTCACGTIHEVGLACAYSCTVIRSPTET